MISRWSSLNWRSLVISLPPREPKRPPSGEEPRGRAQVGVYAVGTMLRRYTTNIVTEAAYRDPDTTEKVRQPRAEGPFPTSLCTERRLRPWLLTVFQFWFRVSGWVSVSSIQR